MLGCSFFHSLIEYFTFYLRNRGQSSAKNLKEINQTTLYHQTYAFQSNCVVLRDAKTTSRRGSSCFCALAQQDCRETSRDKSSCHRLNYIQTEIPISCLSSKTSECRNQRYPSSNNRKRHFRTDRVHLLREVTNRKLTIAELETFVAHQNARSYVKTSSHSAYQGSARSNSFRFQTLVRILSKTTDNGHLSKRKVTISDTKPIQQGVSLVLQLLSSSKSIGIAGPSARDCILRASWNIHITVVQSMSISSRILS